MCVGWFSMPRYLTYLFRDGRFPEFHFRFPFFQRSVVTYQQHCRKCGEVFCSECSAKSFPLPELGYPANRPERVCESCYTTLVVRAERKRDGTGSANQPAGLSGSLSGLDPESTPVPTTEAETEQLREQVIEGLKRLYRSGVKPLEKQFKFDEFLSPMLTDADFDSHPMVLLIGSYSVGKVRCDPSFVPRNAPPRSLTHLHAPKKSIWHTPARAD